MGNELFRCIRWDFIKLRNHIHTTRIDDKNLKEIFNNAEHVYVSDKTFQLLYLKKHIEFANYSGETGIYILGSPVKVTVDLFIPTGDDNIYYKAQDNG